MTKEEMEVVVAFGNKVKNSWYSVSQCNGNYTVKTAAIKDLLKVGAISESPAKTADNVVKFVRSKMTKKTTKWYAGELAMALNWFGFQFKGLEFGENWAKLYFKMYEEFTEWVYYKSGNDKLCDFVYSFCN